MKPLLRYIASTRLTLVGICLLGIGAALSYDNPVDTPVWVLAAPLALLALNLLAAVLSNTRINRRGGLLVFHLGLLGIVALAAIGRLTHMEAHLELVDGNAFSPEELTDMRRGPWHMGDLEQVRFVQGPYTVDYQPGMARGPTRSRVLVPDGRGGWDERVVGDDTPLVLEGYRFYTSFNKGFAPVLTWLPERGAPVTGAVHMPAYPLFDNRQANRWTPPAGGEEIRFWLRLDTGLDPEGHWRLDPARAQGSLIVRAGERRISLQPGEVVRLDGGMLRYERLASWMGYKLFYDPTLPWLFVTAIIAVIGLAAHLWRKFGALQVYAAQQEAARQAGAVEVSGGKPI